MVRPTILLLMGVAGSGKTTIGQLLSRKLQWPFFDADDFHPPLNLARMSAGIPLQEEDRWPWLGNLKEAMKKEIAAGQSAIFACSALKKSYRDFLSADLDSVKLVYLKGDAPLIADRIATRKNHFMKERMLASQLEILEEPEGCLTIDVSAAPEKIAADIITKLAENNP